MDSVSRVHAQIVYEDDIVYIEDLKSKNKTFVNGDPINAKTLLMENDRIRVAEVLFVFHSGEPWKDVDESRAPAAVQDDAGSKVLSVVDALRPEAASSAIRPEARLQAVLEISKALSQTLYIDHVFSKTLEKLLQILPQMDRGLIILKDEFGRLAPKATRHRRGAPDTVRFSQTIVNQAMAERKAILCTDVLEESGLKSLDSLADIEMRSIMCVPLVASEQRPLGVIQVDSLNRVNPFSDDDLHLLAAVASQVTVAIENARLHEDIVQREQMLYAGYVEQEWIKSELELAREVQASFLPRCVPEIPGYRLWSHYEAAVQVGGDFYDWLEMPDGRVALLIADVSGKAISAALFMAKALSDARVAILRHLENPVEAMNEMNRAILASGLVGRFISMALCILDPSKHSLAIVNAGHFSPIMRKSDGRIRLIADSDVSGLLLGVSEKASYRLVEIPMEPSECLVMYTDGVTEALNGERGEQYGLHRLSARVSSVDPEPSIMGEAIVRDVRDHAAGFKQSDDLTLVILAREPSGGLPMAEESDRCRSTEANPEEGAS